MSLGTFYFTLARNNHWTNHALLEREYYISTAWAGFHLLTQSQFCGTALPHCLSNLNRLTLSMMKLWLFALTLSNCLSQNSQNSRAKYRFGKILRTRCRMLREVRFGSQYISLIRAWIFITRNKICVQYWQANTAPSWLWLWRGSESISRDMSTSLFQLCPPFCCSDGERGPKQSSITRTQYETFPHPRSDRHVCSV